MLRVYNVTDLPEYGPARAVVVGGVPIQPGKAHPFQQINLPRGRQVADMRPRTAGVLVLEEGDAIPLQILQAYERLRAPAPEPAPPEPEPDLSRLDDMKSAELREAYQEVVGRPYKGRRSRALVLEKLLGDADHAELSSWLETLDG